MLARQVDASSRDRAVDAASTVKGHKIQRTDGDGHRVATTGSSARLRPAEHRERGGPMNVMSRRDLLALMAALGPAMALTARPGWGQTPTGARIVDTHHHIYPPRYVAANLQRLLADTTTLPASVYTNWSPQVSLEQMDKAGVATVRGVDHEPRGVVGRHGGGAQVGPRV
jgi:hypothetical protein